MGCTYILLRGKSYSADYISIVLAGVSTICYLMFFLSSLFFARPLYDLVLHNYFIWDSVYNTLMQNSSHMALVRCLQLAFSLKLIALDNEGQFDLFWIPFMFINSICNRWVFLYFSSLEWDVWVCLCYLILMNYNFLEPPNFVQYCLI